MFLLANFALLAGFFSISPTIRIGWEMLCLPYAELFKIKCLHNLFKKLEMKKVRLDKKNTGYLICLLYFGWMNSNLVFPVFCIVWFLYLTLSVFYIVHLFFFYFPSIKFSTFYVLCILLITYLYICEFILFICILFILCHMYFMSFSLLSQADRQTKWPSHK